MNNKTSVIVKTAAGLLATQPQYSELLPREARNLLILIDGRKTLEQYHLQLNNMKMFKAVGGVDQYFQLLMDMELIHFETTDSSISTTESNKIPTLTEVIPEKAHPPTSSIPKATKSNIRRHKITHQGTTADHSDDESFVKQFDNVKNLDLVHGKISAQMATTIEQYAQPNDTWGLLMELEGCNTDSELISFLETLAKGNRGPVSKKMTHLMKSLKKSKLI